MKQLMGDLWRQDRRGFLKILMMQSLSSALGSVGIVMLIPLLELVDAGSWQQEEGMLLAVLAVYLGLICGKALLNRSVAIQQTAFLEGYTLSLRTSLYDAVSGAPWQQLSGYRQADLIGLFTNQCSQVSSALSATIRLLTSLVSAAMQIAIACYMSVPVTVTVFACGLGMMAAFLPLRKKAQSYGTEMIAVSRDFYSELFHQLNSVKEIRTYGVEDTHSQRFQNLNQTFRDKQVAYARVHALPGAVSSVAAGILICAVAVLSVFLWQLDMTRVVILVLIFSRLWPLFTGWQSAIQSIQTNLPALEKLKDTIDTLRAAAVAGEEKTALPLEKTVGFSHVAFRYAPEEPPVLEDVSFSLNVGKITALVGRSGAGKSTTADLLMGFLTPDTGEITIDGCPLTRENSRAWRKNIGYIPQSPLLLNDTVRENLKRFHPDATDQELIDALKKAVAWEFVQKLPQGLDTLLGDRGVRLSGGEGQRIVLARVLLGHPRLIVLDEATSALDYESEGAIRDVLSSLRKDAAILVIAHRLATVMIADEAVVLEQGKITESGEFSQLIHNPGGYLAGMVNME